MTLGRVLADGKDRGSAFALLPRVAVTANHVVRDQEPAALQFAATVTGMRVSVERVDRDEQLDVAVLHLSQDVPVVFEVGEPVDGAAWRVESRPRENDPQLTGTISASRHRIVNARNQESIVIQLRVEEELDEYEGYSGSPVVLRSRPAAVIGLLVEQVRSRQAAQLGQSKPASNVLYAIPIQDVVARFGLTPRIANHAAFWLPTPPAHQVTRDDELGALKDDLVGNAGQQYTRSTRVAVVGMGGSGKSVLAAQVARDTDVQLAFPDGVIWLELDDSPLLRRQTQLATALGETQQTWQDTAHARDDLSKLLAERACLIIIDNVRAPAELDAFDALGPRGRILFTTRDGGLAASYGANIHRVGSLMDPQARALLAHWAELSVEALPPEADELLSHCGGLPIAIAMAGAMVRGRTHRWPSLLTKLRDADIGKIAARLPGYPHPNLLAALAIGVEDLNSAGEERGLDSAYDRYLDLAVFAGRGPIPPAPLLALWQPDLDVDQAGDYLELFIDRSMAVRDRDGRVMLHDLQMDEITSRAREKLPSLHRQLVDGYARRCPTGWGSALDDGYLYDHLAHHFAQAGDLDGLRGLLGQAWLRAQRNRTGSSWAFAQDLEVGITQARRLGEAGLVDLFRWCYARSIVSSQATDVPPAAIGALVYLGHPQRARGYARLSGTPERKAATYLSMAEAALAEGDTDAATEFAEQVLPPIAGCEPAQLRIRLLSELSAVARSLDLAALREHLATALWQEAIDEIKLDGPLDWAVNSAAAAVRALARLGENESARELGRALHERVLAQRKPPRGSGIGEDPIHTTALLTRTASSLRLLDLDEEAQAVQARADQAFDDVNRAVPNQYVYLGYAKQFVSALVESGDVDGALSVAEQWVVAGGQCDYAAALVEVARAKLTVDARSAAELATKARGAAQECLAQQREFGFSDSAESVQMLADVGSVLVQVGEAAEAVELARRLEPSERKAAVLATVGHALAAAHLPEASSIIEECLQASAGVGSGQTDQARALADVGLALARVHAPAEASVVLGRARSLLHAADDRDVFARGGALKIAQAFALLGQREEALSMLTWRHKLDPASDMEYSVDALEDLLNVAECIGHAQPSHAEALVLEVAERARGSKQRPETLACLLARAADALSGIDSMESALRLARQAVSVIGEVEYPQDGGRFREACRLSAGVVAAHASIDEALRVARLAEKAHVEEPERLVLLGILSALSRAGRNAETVDIARKLVAIAPSQRLVLAEALIRAGSPDEAEAVGRTALTDNLSGMPVATRDRA